MDKFLQRGRVLTAFRPSEQLNINAMNKGDLFVALVFYHIFILCGNHDRTLEMVFGSQAVNLDKEADDGISIPLLRSMM